jgi:hypothetical protein
MKSQPKILLSNERGQISKSGYWIIEDVQAEKEHAFDPFLAIAIKNLVFKLGYHGEELYDLGCGKGDYVKMFNHNGIKAIGFDGNPNTKKFCKNCEIHDLTKPLPKIPTKFVMSLEVAEHIPKDKEYLYIKTVNEAVCENGYLIISWAYPGQGGYGHFNELDNAYCKKLFLSLGYENKEDYEKYLRYKCKLKWFKYTIMVFQKKQMIQMDDTQLKDLYLSINEEATENIKTIQKLRKIEETVRFSNRSKWNISSFDSKYPDLDFETKDKLYAFFESIYYNSDIQLNEKIEILNQSLSLQQLPSFTQLNLSQLENNKIYQTIRLSLIRNILKDQDHLIMSFPKEYRVFLIKRKTLFLKNFILLSLMWYFIFFVECKENDKRMSFYPLYIKIFKNKFKYSRDILQIINQIDGFYIFCKQTLVESYISRKNTHLHFLLKDMNLLSKEYLKHNELDIIDDVREPVYTKLMIDIKAYGFDESDSVFNYHYINSFFKRSVNLLSPKYLQSLI